MGTFLVEEWSSIGNSIKNTEDYETVIEVLIKKFTVPGDIILDPMAGKGETLSVCHNCNRNGIGLESNVKNFEFMKDRMKKLEGQLKLDFIGAKEKCKQLVLHGGAGEMDTLWQEFFLPVVDLVVMQLRKDKLKEASAIIEKVSLKLKIKGIVIIMIPLDLERDYFFSEIRKKGWIVDEDLIIYSSRAVWTLVRRD